MRLARSRAATPRLARLARSLEESGHSAESVAHFLMRSLFSMFAEDVGLLPEGGFTGLLEEIRREGSTIFAPMVESFWQSMNTGGFSPILKRHLLRFNGGLFESAEALPLDTPQPEAEMTRTAAAGKRLAWPRSLPEQVKAVRQALSDAATDCDAAELAGGLAASRV